MAMHCLPGRSITSCEPAKNIKAHSAFLSSVCFYVAEMRYLALC